MAKQCGSSMSNIEPKRNITKCLKGKLHQPNYTHVNLGYKFGIVEYIVMCTKLMASNRTHLLGLSSFIVSSVYFVLGQQHLT